MIKYVSDRHKTQEICNVSGLEDPLDVKICPWQIYDPRYIY